MPCFSPVDAYQLDSGRVIFHENVGTAGKRHSKFTRPGGYLRSLKISCGQCVGCRKDRSHQWAARILHESQSHTAPSWFATLTDDDAHTPADGSLDYSVFQTFVDNLRAALNPRAPRGSPKKPRVKVRYFVAGEYGTKKVRPHYHAAFFGLDLPDLAYLRMSPSGHKLYTSAMLEKVWGRGFISLGALSWESAAYIASYVCKKQTGPKATAYLRVDPNTGECHSVRPEFARMSLRPAIGKEWFKKFHADCLPRDYCVVDGRKVPVPRYYRDLFKKMNPHASDDLQHDRIERAALSAHERTPERLATRETVAKAALSLKNRNL